MLIRASEQGHDDPADDIDPPEHQESEDGEDPSDDPAGEEPEDDGHDEDPDAGEEPEPRREQSRGSERIRNQAKLNREEREARERAERRAEEAERRAQEAERRASDTRSREEAEEERQALAAMSDQERNTYMLAKQVRGLQGQQNAAALLNQDTRDANRFASYIAREPRFTKYADEVDRIANEAISRGQFVARDLILNQLIAADVRKNGNNVTKQRKEAKQRIDNERGRSGSARSDAGSRGGSRLTLAQRMERDDPAI